MLKKHIYSVSELNQVVQHLLTESFPSIWISGEVSNFACPHSGHWYFSLKDAKAQVRCILFHAVHRYKTNLLYDGMQILVCAKISFYPVRGEFQLIVEQFEPAGEGALRKAFEKLKTQLAAEGLFDVRHKKTLPSFPKTIGVITSESSAVIRDICSVLKQRFPRILILIYPCPVQGKKAASRIVQQIQVANHRQECDVLILARGGGSLEDLWPFNEECVARAIFNSQLPLVSAIGHETDFTIADFVADHRAATPSIAAQLVSPNRHEYQTLLTKTYHRLTKNLQYLLHSYHQTLENLHKRLWHPKHQLQNTTQHLDELTQRLYTSIRIHIQIQQQKLQGLSRTLHAVSPLITLERGYAIVNDVETDKIIRDSRQLQLGQKILTKLAKGKLLCQIEAKWD